jgi:hypothetical protein
VREDLKAACDLSSGVHVQDILRLKFYGVDGIGLGYGKVDGIRWLARSNLVVESWHMLTTLEEFDGEDS